MMGTAIYLAGKVREKPSHGPNWRHALVSGWNGDQAYGYSGPDGLDFIGSCGNDIPPGIWPTLPKAVLGVFDYVGPYVVRCDHGCFHTGDHASYCNWSSGESPDKVAADIAARKSARDTIIFLCMMAIRKADIVFFWIDRMDCYGTIAELMIAAKNRKKIVIATPDPDAIDEMWFSIQYAMTTCPDTKLLIADTPQQALQTLIDASNYAPELSPIERAFLEAWERKGIDGIVVQYDVPGTKFRVDFAFPDKKLAVELDGYAYHSDKATFTKDRQRQRVLEQLGWRIIRFSGSEVFRDVESCALEVRNALTKYNGGSPE